MCVKSVIVNHNTENNDNVIVKGDEDDNDSMNDDIKIDVEEVGSDDMDTLGIYETESDRIKSQSMLFNGHLENGDDDDDDNDTEEPEPMISTFLNNDNHHTRDQQTPSINTNSLNRNNNHKISMKKCNNDTQIAQNGRNGTGRTSSINNGTSSEKICKYNNNNTNVKAESDNKKLKEVVEKIKNKFNNIATISNHATTLPNTKNHLPKLTNGHTTINHHSNGDKSHQSEFIAPNSKSKLSRKRSINCDSVKAPESSMEATTSVPMTQAPSFEPPASLKPKQTKFLKTYDPDKHCGVSVMGSKPCTRSLTCKKHSIALRRQVEGRSRPFNELFKQYRDEKMHQSHANASYLNSVEVNKTISHTAISVQSSSSDYMKQPPLPMPDVNFINSNVNINAHLNISCNSNGNRYVETMIGSSANVKMLNETKLVNENSSSGGDAVSEQSHSLASFSKDGYFMSSHPRPLAVCTYGARTVGSSGFVVWNRKQDHFRSVLNRTFEVYSHRKNALNLIAQQKQQQQQQQQHQIVMSQSQHQFQTHYQQPPQQQHDQIIHNYQQQTQQQQSINIPQPQIIQQQQQQVHQQQPAMVANGTKRMPTVNRAGVVNRLFKNRIIVSK